MKRLIQHYQKHSIKYWGVLLTVLIILYLILTTRPSQ
jgi:hypothetical protein